MTKPDLRALRLERGWTLEGAALEIGCSVGTLSCWERELTQPSEYFEHRLCKVYGLEPWRDRREVVKTALAQWIIRNTKELHLTFMQLAKESSYSYAYIQEVASGRYCPDNTDCLIEFVTHTAEVFARHREQKKEET